MIYDPLEFWTENGKSNIEYHSNQHKIQEQKLLEYLKTLNFKSVLELGCGYGRITDLIINNFDIDEYIGIDISKEQINKAQAKYQSYSNIMFLNIDVTRLKFKPLVMADLVLAVDTLMHIKPDNIHNVIASMINLSRKHIINMDYYIDTKQELADYNFKHEYKDHYTSLGYSVDTITVTEIDQCIFHVYM